MLAWSEGTDNGRQKTLGNHGYDVIVGGELFADYSVHLADLSLRPDSNQQGAGRCFFPLVQDACKQLGLKDFSPKSQDAP